MNKININDPKYWQNIDWDEPEQPALLKKTDTQVNRSRSAFFKKGNPEFGATMSNIARNRDETYWQNHQQGVEQRDNTYQAECNTKLEVRERISASMKGKQKSQEHIDKVAAKTRERAKPVVTPWGVFRSGKLAGEAYNAMTNTKNGKNRVSHHINRGTPGYRFISIEEYQKLTLNNPGIEK